jgi:hypothetical protein
MKYICSILEGIKEKEIILLELVIKKDKVETLKLTLNLFA